MRLPEPPAASLASEPTGGPLPTVGPLPIGGAVPTVLATLAERAARAAGSLVHDERPAGLQLSGTKSSPTDIVTQMDLAAEELLRDLLGRARPDDGRLGEEGGYEAGGSGLTWVVDPIDGTVNYLYGIPAYAVSVAVVTGDPRSPGRWSPVAGCVHSPASGETWTAALGGGATLNGVPLSVPPPPPLERALVGTGFGYRDTRRRAQARVFATLLPQVRDVRRIGSAAMDLCMVATGRLDAYFERGLNPWDMAAAMLVVREAGGRVIGLDGAPPGDQMVVAAADPLVGVLARRLSELGAASDDPHA